MMFSEGRSKDSSRPNTAGLPHAKSEVRRRNVAFIAGLRGDDPVTDDSCTEPDSPEGEGGSSDA